MDTNTDNKALGRFKMGYVQDGLGGDGLPLYREMLQIVIERPPLLKIERTAEEADFDAYEEEYKTFQKQQDARKQQDGYPLALWPVVNAPDLENCAARDITTVQQLAEMRLTDKIPPAIRELAERARQMVKLQAETGKYEQIITGLTAERDELAAQLKEAHGTISAQSSMIDTLKMRVT
jgi:hypothetical protein